MCIGGAQGSKTVKIQVFFIFSIVKDLEDDKKIMKFLRPYGVTHKCFSMIFSDFHEDFKVDIWKI